MELLRETTFRLQEESFSKRKNSLMSGGKAGAFNFDFIAGADYKSSGLESGLTINESLPGDSLQNRLRLNDLRIYFSPSLRFSHKKMVLNVQIPVNYNFRRLTESGESLSKSGSFPRALQ